MLRQMLGKFRFRLRTLFVVMLGIAIGYSLNLHTLQLLTDRWSNPRPPRPYVIEPPDVLAVRITGISAIESPTPSEHYRVEPDGRIYLGRYGSVYVAGLTISDAQKAIERVLAKRIKNLHVTVDLWATNSKMYYVIRHHPNGLATVTQAPITGNETVLDAIAQIGGLQASDAVEICVSRPAPKGIGAEKKLAVEWSDITSGASTATNYTLLPSDRVIISQANLRSATHCAKNAGARSNVIRRWPILCKCQRWQPG
jgi:protein involved in polysaccharide export with SLBB domain